MRSTPTTLGLALLVSLAALGAACGPPPPPETPGATTAAPATTNAPAVTAAPTVKGPELPPAASSPPAPTAPPATSAASSAGPPSVAVQPSAMLDGLKRIGLDGRKLPLDLEKMELAQKKKLMPLFQKAMGFASCTGCHVDGDFKKDTRNMKITRGMWRHYVVELRDDKGGPVFCDTCHQGAAKVLNRSDLKALSTFMADNYEAKFSRADKKEHACGTCHGDEMEMKIIEKLWKIPPK